MKRVSVFLFALMMVFCLLCTIPLRVDATAVSQADAVAWARSKIGVGLDYDGAYGNQCVDLIYYYYSYLGVSPVGGNACDYSSNTLPSGWTRISSNIVPQPGDIAVWKSNITTSSGTMITGWAGHVGIVTSGNASTFGVIHQNYAGHTTCVQTDGQPVSYLACVIRPNFSSTDHTHNYNTFEFYWKEHPHYNCYSCSCGAIDANYSEPVYLSTCEQCRAEKPVNVSWTECPNRESIGSTNAVLAHYCHLDGVNATAVSNVGIYIYDYKGTEIRYHIEPANLGTYTTFDIWFNLNDELGFTIQPGTTYQYKFFSVIDGEKYYSPVYTFTSTGTHSHKYDSGKVTASPTCGKEGSKVYTCTTCGGTKTESIAKLTSHSYNSGKVTKAATCKETGVKTYTCTVCGGTKTETIAKLTTHSYNSGVVTKQPTCKETGVKTYTCTVCGTTKTETVAKLTTHSYNNGVVTKQPTCKETGVKTYTCTVCSVTKTETIAKLTTHSYDNGTVTKAATCKEDGIKTFTCTVCGATKTETIAKLTTHSYNSGVATKQPTCKETGVKTYTCTVCGDSYTEEIAKLTTHSYDDGVETKAPTCKETGIKTYTCTVCGDSYTEEIAKLTTHSYENGTCTVCGSSDPDYVPPTEPTEPSDPTAPEEPTEPEAPTEPGEEKEESTNVFMAILNAILEALTALLAFFGIKL